PLKAEVKRQGLWAAHLPPDMGGLGFGQVKLGLMHEILGQCGYAPSIFGNNAPTAKLCSGGSNGFKQRLFVHKKQLLR
ncbi:MAG: acyl-CoA dehydrogenase, partial [Alphaproteobacteria bacterium]|nr:acyl-CoA dehydrogenase [Alphaproteobacteria bacterium]